ncbi:MAG: hypothetical protein NVSMB51_16520 [Solirubrobacteraceae bacterium]
MVFLFGLILLPLLELFVIIRVSEAIGFGFALLALLACSFVGVRLIRSQGRLVMRRAMDAMAVGRTPAREVLDGALVFLGGLLLVVPGFVTAAVGALLLLPPTRALVRRLLLRHWTARVLSSAARAARGRRPSAPDDIEGTAVEVPTRELPRR